jgi:hypothetical protein
LGDKQQDFCMMQGETGVPSKLGLLLQATAAALLFINEQHNIVLATRQSRLG